MPHPLSRVRPSAEIEVSSGAIPNRPDLAVSVMRVIAIWAEIESDAAVILSRMLKADISIGIAMYQSLTGGVSRKAAFMAAAQAALAEWQLILLRAVLNASNGSRNTRNDFAHNIWATTKDLPDALLLMPPSVRLGRHLKFREGTPDPRPDGAADHYDFSKIYVYRKPDLDRAVEAALDAAVHHAYLYAITGPQVVEQARRLLLREPRIQQALEPLIRESSPEVREILRPPADDEPPPKGLYPETSG
jgi:hypothetical protein